MLVPPENDPNTPLSVTCSSWPANWNFQTPVGISTCVSFKPKPQGSGGSSCYHRLPPVNQPVLAPLWRVGWAQRSPKVGARNYQPQRGNLSSALTLNKEVYVVVTKCDMRLCMGSWNQKTALGEFPLWLSELQTPLVSMRMQVWSLASLSGLRILCCRVLGVVSWCGSDLTLLWLWRRLADTVHIWSLAKELPNAVSVAI